MSRARLARRGAVCALIAGCMACSERLPTLPPTQPVVQQLVTVEGVIRRGVDGRSEPVPMPYGRLEVLGVGVVRTDVSGFYRLPRLVRRSGPDARVLGLRCARADGLPADRASSLHVAEQHQRSGPCRHHGRRGSVQGRVEMPDGIGAGGVIAFVEGVPGADDLTGPDGSFFLHGVPEGAVRVGFMFEDYVVAPQALIDVDVVAYQSTVIPETVRLAPPPGQPALAPVTVKVHLEAGMDAAALEVVTAPLLARSWAGQPDPLQAAVKAHAVPADGVLNLAWDYPEPHTVTLRQKVGAQGLPVRTVRRVYVTPGSAPVNLYAAYGGRDEDGDGSLDIADLDGDGVADAEDDDPDGDGCEDESVLTAQDPFSCGDNDGDGVADALDPDDDDDGTSDLEELTAGVDGLTSDHRSASDRILPVRGEVNGWIVTNAETEIVELDRRHPIYGAIARHHAHYGDELLGGVYRVSAEAERVGAHVTGYTGRHSTLRVTVLSDAEREEGYALDERMLPGWDLDCATNLRGRKTCPEALLMQPIETASLIWVSALGGLEAPLRCGDGSLDPGEECDDGNLDDLGRVIGAVGAPAAATASSSAKRAVMTATSAAPMAAWANAASPLAAVMVLFVQTSMRESQVPNSATTGTTPTAMTAPTHAACIAAVTGT